MTLPTVSQHGVMGGVGIHWKVQNNLPKALGPGKKCSRTISGLFQDCGGIDVIWNEIYLNRYFKRPYRTRDDFVQFHRIIEAIWGFSWSWTVQGVVLEQELNWSFQKGATCMIILSGRCWSYIFSWTIVWLKETSFTFPEVYFESTFVNIFMNIVDLTTIKWPRICDSIFGIYLCHLEFLDNLCNT